MDTHLIEYLESEVMRFYKTDGEKEKQIIRNSLFEKIRPFMDRWIKSNLKTSQLYIEEDERLSLNWDCFLYCLESYCPERNISLPRHFYQYTRFFLLSWLEKSRKTRDFQDLFHREEGDNPETLYSILDELKKFRETIPEDYYQIFDDALLSIAGRPQDRVPYVKSTGYTYYKYCEAKKAFKLIIQFLLLK
jgi:hypothetical protein